MRETEEEWRNPDKVWAAHAASGSSHQNRVFRPYDSVRFPVLPECPRREALSGAEGDYGDSTASTHLTLVPHPSAVGATIARDRNA